MFEEKCVIATTARKVKAVGEHKKSAVFLNCTEDEFLKIRIDGCVIKDGKKADWLVEKISTNAAVIIELKGKNVGYALEQIEETLIFLKKKGYAKKIAGLVVCNEYPSVNTKIQRAKDSFRKKYAMYIHAVTKNEEYVFEKLFTSSPLSK